MRKSKNTPPINSSAELRANIIYFSERLSDSWPTPNEKFEKVKSAIDTLLDLVVLLEEKVEKLDHEIWSLRLAEKKRNNPEDYYMP